MNPTFTNPNFAGVGSNYLNNGLPTVNPVMDATQITNPIKPLKLQPSSPLAVPDISTLGVTMPQKTEATPGVPATQAEPQAGVFSRLNTALQGISTKVLGKEQETQSAVAAATLPYEQQLNEISGMIKMHQATALQNQERALQSGETSGFASREAQNIQRTDAIEALKLNAIADSLQGNISLAEKRAKLATDAKFAQYTQDIDVARNQIIDNWDSFTAAEKKKAQATLLKLDKDDAFVAQAKEDDKAIQEIGFKLAQYGVDMKTIQGVLSAGSVSDALAMAGSKLQDPRMKMEMESIRIDQTLKKAQIKKANYELELLQKYDGLSPSEYAKALKEEQETIKNAKDEKERVRLQGQSLDGSIILIGSILDSKAIDSVVGPTSLSRAPTSAKGVASRIGASVATGATVGAFGGPVGAILGGIGGVAYGVANSLQGRKDAITGSADYLVGQTEQFISKKFLDNLIESKAAGATFGALTKPEQDALTAAATAIGQRRIYEGKGEERIVVGYDMAEKDYKREMNTILDLTKKARERVTGSSFGQDEEAVLDSLYNSALEPDSMSFYNQ